MNRKSYLYLYLLFSIIFSNNNLKFSANYLENIIENDIEKRIFNDNVIINNKSMILYTSKAIYEPSLQKVTLIGDVKMIDNNDSLFCDKLILYDRDYKNFESTGNIKFYKGNQFIKCEQLFYEELSKNNDIEIELFGSAEIVDSTNKVQGDSLIINYKDSLINNININSNAKFFNYRIAKFNASNQYQNIEDKMSSKKMMIDFNNGEVNNIQLLGMASTMFNVVEDTLVTGTNSSSADSILIEINNNNINRMKMYGGVEGKFNPELNNSRVDSTVIYQANYIDYQLYNDVSYLYDNSLVNYDSNELKADEIFIDWENNMLEARIKDSVYPSINGFGESPIFGEKMEFDLISKKGKITKGKTNFNQSFYNGDTLTKDKNELFYINNSLFTTCELDHPHYYFHSNQMKMIPNDRIIAKPMTLYIRDLPIFYLPFAVFPNKNGDRISGWIMPTFGHRSSTGTYLDNLGYYYVLNNYSDYTFLFDIQDKKGIIANHEYRYKIRSGESWYNYMLEGYMKYETKNYLADNDEDISNLFSNNSQKIKNITFFHKQSFDPTQNVIVNYKYKSSLDPKEINLNSRLDQNKLSSLSYQKRWEKNSLSIGFEEYEDLYVASPTQNNQINSYKWLTGPKISFSLPQRKLLGNGDSWFNDIYLSYNLSYDHGKETYIKNSCVDNNIDGLCNNEDGDELNEGGEIIWSNSDEIDLVKGGAKNIIQLSMNSNLNWLSITPRFTIIEDWLWQSRDYSQSNTDNIYSYEYDNNSDFNRRLTWNASINLNTKIYGILPLNVGSLISLRHKVSPQIIINYIPNLKNTYNSQLQKFEENGSIISKDILEGTYANSLYEESQKIRFSLSNAFQIKTKNNNGDINKRDFLNIDMTTDYDNNAENKFSLIDSRWSFKKDNGGELFFIHMQHNIYDEINNEDGTISYTNLLSKGKSPKLEFLKAQMSTRFSLRGISQNIYDDISLSSEQKDTTNFNSILSMDQFKPKINNDEVWRSDINLSIQGEYDIEEKKWDFNYFNLDSYNTIHLTKNWLFTYISGINLIDMKINSQSLKFYRELHCWEFMFTWWPNGFSKGFQLSINVKHPDLQDVKVRSSSSNRQFNIN
tara:strand:- start:2605 stop:5904 length:3300 start_codon:yes stop_codon:yes gene_type:complete